VPPDAAGDGLEPGPAVQLLRVGRSRAAATRRGLTAGLLYFIGL